MVNYFIWILGKAVRWMLSSHNQAEYRRQHAVRQVPHYGLRRLSVGVASVLLSTTFFLGEAHADQIANNSVGTSPEATNSLETGTVGEQQVDDQATVGQATVQSAPVQVAPSQPVSVPTIQTLNAASQTFVQNQVPVQVPQSVASASVSQPVEQASTSSVVPTSSVAPVNNSQVNQQAVNNVNTVQVPVQYPVTKINVSPDVNLQDPNVTSSEFRLGFRDVATNQIIGMNDVVGKLGTNLQDVNFKLPDHYEAVNTDWQKKLPELSTGKLLLDVGQTGSAALDQARQKLLQEQQQERMLAIFGNSFVVSSGIGATQVANRSYGVDVSDYQSNDMGRYARNGAKFAIIKIAEGNGPQGGTTSWTKAANAKAAGMMVMGYQFYHYAGSVQGAINEAKYCLQRAHEADIPVHSYLAIDWESEGGPNHGSYAENTAEAIAWMRTIRNAGYLPMFYSGSAYAESNFNLGQILAQFPGSLWIASYPYSTYNRPAWSAPMGSFPSMNGVAIWQFTNDLYGLSTDGNINVLPLQFLQVQAPKPKQVTVHVRFIDDDDNGKVVGTPSRTYNVNTTFKYNDFRLPTEYHWINGQNGNTTARIGEGDMNLDIHVKHNTENKTDSKNVTRHWEIDMPNGEVKHGDQTATFNRTGWYDRVTKQTHWNNWSPAQQFKAIDVPKSIGYTASGSIPVITVNVNDQNSSIKITYTQDAPTYSTVKDTKQVTRSWTITYPSGINRGDEQKVTLTRTGKKNNLTGDIQWGAWSTGAFGGVQIPKLDGFTPSGDIPEVQVNGDTPANTTIHITYQKNATAPSEQSWQNRALAWENNANMKRTDGLMYGLDDHAKVSDHELRYIVYNPTKDNAVIEFDGDHNIVDLNTGNEEPNTKDTNKNFVPVAPQLTKHARQIVLHKPIEAGGDQAVNQDPVDYSAEQYSKFNGNFNNLIAISKVNGYYPKYETPKLDGYYPDIKSVPKMAVSQFGPDGPSQVNIKYEPYYYLKVYDADDNNKLVDNETMKSVFKTGNDYVPTNYLMKDYHYDGNTRTMTLHVTHQLQPMSDRRTVKRLYDIKLPDGQQQIASQTHDFVRSGHKDLVTGKTSWDSWNPQSFVFPAVEVPNVDGYTADKSIPALTVNGDSQDSTVIVTYQQSGSQSQPSTEAERPAVDPLAQKLVDTVKPMVGWFTYGQDRPITTTKSGIKPDDIKSVDDLDRNGRLDCSGLVWLGIKLAGEKVVKASTGPWYTGSMASDAKTTQDYLKEITDPSKLQPGDVIIVDAFGGNSGDNGHTAIIDGYGVDYGLTKDSTMDDVLRSDLPILEMGGGPKNLNESTIKTAFSRLANANDKVVTLASPAAWATNQPQVVIYTVDLEDLDDNNNIIKTSTTKQLPSDYKSLVPENYLFAGSSLNGNKLVLRIRHQTTTVSDNKTVIRHLVIKMPNGQDQHADQKVIFGRAGVKDKVTGQTTWQSWDPANAVFKSVDVPEIGGYTPSGRIDQITVTPDSQDSTVIISYTKNSSPTTSGGDDHHHGDQPSQPVQDQFVVSVVDVDNNNQELKHEIVKSLPSSYDSYVPTNYRLAGYGLNNKTLTIKVRHNTTTVSQNKTVIRHLIIKMPNGQEQKDDQKVIFGRAGVKDLVTGKTDWKAWDPANAQFDAVDVPIIGGFTPSGSIVATSVTPDSQDSTVIITYTKNNTPTKPGGDDQHGDQPSQPTQDQFVISVIDVDNHNQELKHEMVKSLPSSYDGYIPTNYSLAGYGFNNQTLTLKVRHNTTAVTQDKTVSRQIIIVMPNGQKQMGHQEVSFGRAGIKDLVTGKTDWKAWNPANAQFDAISVPEVGGFTPSGTIDSMKVTPDSQSNTVRITYTKNNMPTTPDEGDHHGQQPGEPDNPGQSGDHHGDQPSKPTQRQFVVNVIDVDNNSQQIKHESLKNLPSSYDSYVPTNYLLAGYHLDGQTLTIQVRHQTQTVTQDKTVSRQIVIAMPNGSKQTGEQSVTFGRAGVKDLVTGKTSWKAWNPANAQFDAIDVPVVGGFEASGKIDAMSVTPDTNDSVVTITYRRVGDQTSQTGSSATSSSTSSSVASSTVSSGASQVPSSVTSSNTSSVVSSAVMPSESGSSLISSTTHSSASQSGSSEGTSTSGSMASSNMSSSISHVTSSGSVSTAMPNDSNVNSQASSVVSGSASHQVISSSSMVSSGVTVNNSQSNSYVMNQSTVNNSQVASGVISSGVVSSNGTISGFNGSLAGSVSNDYDNQSVGFSRIDSEHQSVTNEPSVQELSNGLTGQLMSGSDSLSGRDLGSSTNHQAQSNQQGNIQPQVVDAVKTQNTDGGSTITAPLGVSARSIGGSQGNRLIAGRGSSEQQNLPQTGSTQSKQAVMIGGSLLLGAIGLGAGIRRKKRE